MNKHIITVEDSVGSTSTIDLREIAVIHQDVEGDVEVLLKSGESITLDEPESDVVEDLLHRWTCLVTFS